jgi:hypothetical protein
VSDLVFAGIATAGSAGLEVFVVVDPDVTGSAVAEFVELASPEVAGEP